jgi:Tfp pilus assembly protein PilF
MQVKVLIIALLFLTGACASAPKGELLPMRSSLSSAAVEHNEAGRHAFTEGQWSIARQQFESAIQASPGSAAAHYNLGMVLYRTGAVKEAAEHFTIAAALEPGDPIIWSAPGLDRRAVESFRKSNHGHAHSH